MTEKLYDTDSYIEEFECKVINLYGYEGDLAVETDRTAFFPEGGGQTADTGTLGNLEVYDVQIKCGKLLHYVKNFEENYKKISVGEKISGKINMKKRFSDMQQHTGEHIFSGIVNKLYGYDNVGFHLGSQVVTLDFNGELKNDDICKVENLVNKAIWDNLEVRVFFPTEKELKTINYRSKKEINEALRLVEIPGVDMCACCAPHVKRTGEIGIVKVVSSEKHRGGTRVSILCGERALIDKREKLEENKKVSNLFFTKETETFKMAEKLKSDNAQLSYELSKAKLDFLKLKAQSVEDKERIVVFCDIEDTNDLREYADILSEKAKEFAAVFSGKDEDFKYVIITKNDYDVNSLCKELNSQFSGRGGGRGGIVQGSLKGEKEKIKEKIE